MIVTVQLFARARELAGCEKALLVIADNAAVADARQELARTYPQLAGLLEKSAMAVNDEYVDDGCLLCPEAQLALLPPVSGG